MIHMKSQDLFSLKMTFFFPLFLNAVSVVVIGTLRVNTQ